MDEGRKPAISDIVSEFRSEFLIALMNGDRKGEK